LVTFIVEISKINPRVDNARTCNIEDSAKGIAKLFGISLIFLFIALKIYVRRKRSVRHCSPVIRNADFIFGLPIALIHAGGYITK